MCYKSRTSANKIDNMERSGLGISLKRNTQVRFARMFSTPSLFSERKKVL